MILTLHLVEIGLLIAVLYVEWQRTSPPTPAPESGPTSPEGPITYPSLSLHLCDRQGHVRHEQTVHQPSPPLLVTYGGVSYYKTDYTQDDGALVYQERTRMSDQ